MTTSQTTTSAVEQIREAARLMRERAEKATPGPWRYEPELFDGTVLSDSPDVELPWGALVVEPGPTEQARKDGEHIAGWHPAVALAVADWLDSEANSLGVHYGAESNPAVKVARAYLGTNIEAVTR